MIFSKSLYGVMNQYATLPACACTAVTAGGLPWYEHTKRPGSMNRSLRGKAFQPPDVLVGDAAPARLDPPWHG
jgi:hypothetical protein